MNRAPEEKQLTSSGSRQGLEVPSVIVSSVVREERPTVTDPLVKVV